VNRNYLFYTKSRLASFLRIIRNATAAKVADKRCRSCHNGLADRRACSDAVTATPLYSQTRSVVVVRQRQITVCDAIIYPWTDPLHCLPCRRYWWVNEPADVTWSGKIQQLQSWRRTCNYRVRQKSSPLKFFAVFSATARNFNLKFYTFICWNLLHLTAK